MIQNLDSNKQSIGATKFVIGGWFVIKLGVCAICCRENEGRRKNGEREVGRLSSHKLNITYKFNDEFKSVSNFVCKNNRSLYFLFLFANFPVMMCICKAHDHHGKRVQLSQYVNIDNTVTSKTPFEFSIFRLSLIIIYIVFLVVSASPHLSRSWNLRPSQVSVIFYFVIWF